MDYEKAYKNLVAKVKNAHLFAQTDSTKNVLEDILPELRESEDERIRRWIIKELESKYVEDGLVNSKYADKALAWLEKQKEKKFDFELIKQAWYMEGYKDREFGKESKWIIKTGNDGPKYEENPKYGQPLTETQKPAEIDFEDWDTLGYIRDIVRKHVIRDEEFNALDKWLTEHYIIQKPVEKQDYSGLNDLERAIHRGFLSAGIENIPVTIIKETAKECLAQMKPTEWSEEDEEIRDSIICILQKDITYTPPTRPNSCTGSGNAFYTHQTEIDWLKSLRPRPSWKPSEEQMDALIRCIAPLEHKYYCILSELYEQLKKL